MWEGRNFSEVGNLNFRDFHFKLVDGHFVRAVMLAEG